MTQTLQTQASTVLITAQRATADRKSGSWRRTRWVLRTVLPIAAALVGVLLTWLFVSYVVLNPDRREILVPPPQEVLNTSFRDWAHLHPMLSALQLDIEVSMTGLAIATAMGILAAIVMSLASWLERSLYPYAVVLQTVPILAIVPLIGLWFQYGFNARVIVVVIIAIFPMIANTLFGIHSADPGAHDVFTLNRASRWQRLAKLQLPAALPSIFAGLRISSGLSVIGAIVGDFFFTQGQPGLGTLLNTYLLRVQSSDLFAAIILSSLFGIAVFAVFTFLSKLAVGSWYSGAQSRTNDR